MRNTGTRKILFGLLFAVLSAMLFCEELERAVMSGTSETIAITTNRTAGKDGSVSYFKPSLSNPKNENYEYFGVSVKNDQGSAEYILLVDKISMTATMYQVVFKGKTITFLENGLPNDNATFAELWIWEMNISPDSQQKDTYDLPTYSQYCSY